MFSDDTISHVDGHSPMTNRNQQGPVVVFCSTSDTLKKCHSSGSLRGSSIFFFAAEFMTPPAFNKIQSINLTV